MKNRIRSLALLVPLTVCVVACSSSAVDDGQEAKAPITVVSRDDLNAKLDVLTTAQSVSVVDAKGDDGRADLAALEKSIEDDADAPRWIAAAGTEGSPHIVRVTLENGQKVELVTREWQTGSTDAPTSRSALTLVRPAIGEVFTYAERHEYTGNVDKASLYLLDSSALKQVSSSTFDPAQTTSTTRSLNFLTANVDAGATSGHSLSCSACANALLVAKLAGVVAAYGLGTGAATAVCAIVGIPTAEAGGLVCHLVVVAVSAAMTLPMSFDDRASVCNTISHDILGAPYVCP